MNWDRFMFKLARLVPYKLRYYIVLNAGVDATTGQYGNQIVPELKHFEALERMK